MKSDTDNQSSITERRRFMAAGACLGAAAGMAPAGAMAKVAAGFVKDAAAGLPFNAARFRACLGGGFLVRSLVRDVAPVSMTLARVELSPFQTPAQAKKESAFSIDLAGAAAPMAQDTYIVSHPDFGQFIALLVPSADGRTLVGVFNTAA